MSDQISRANVEGALAEIRQQVAAHWGWFLALGLVLILAGCAAIAFPCSPRSPSKLHWAGCSSSVGS